jgi:putative membrane protein
MHVSHKLSPSQSLPNKTVVLKVLGAAALGIAGLAFFGTQARAEGLASKDKRFMTDAAEAGSTEINASKIALEKSANPAIKDFAEMMIGDHTTASDELKKLAASKNVTLPDGPGAMQKAKIAVLSKLSGAHFDREYASVIGVSAHTDAVALFQKASTDAQDADVKQFASKILPTLQHHLEMAKKLQANTQAAK